MPPLYAGTDAFRADASLEPGQSASAHSRAMRRSPARSAAARRSARAAPVAVDRVCANVRPGWTVAGAGHDVACHRFARDGRAGLP